MTLAGGGISLLPTYSTMYSDQLRLLDVVSPTMVANLWIISGDEDLRDLPLRMAYDAIVKAFASFEW
ncbi:hypothetical protein [Azospirillum halopraeferens]|uniref:hypothetical protein n=1 Tax=Azospirillum halopraeferens TaxID=34010 RepID=UPI00048E915A|nr:hypothetical protein [Azospirillum halopraeferens]